MAGFNHRTRKMTLATLGVGLACIAIHVTRAAAAPQGIDEVRARAEAGDAEAQNRLGELYMFGEGLEHDKQAALLWFRKSAKQGNADAMCNLAVAYYNGSGVSTSDILSLAWFLAAQKAGCERASEAVQRAESQLRPWDVLRAYDFVAEMYQKGEELPKDDAEAVQWWQKAALRGDADAQVSLAVIFLNGKGVPQDLVQGRHWCDELEKKHDSRGSYCLGYIRQHGLGGDLDAAAARKLYAKAALDHYPPAMKALAGMEAKGEGGKVDRISASLLYARLAARGDQESLQSLAEIKAQMSPKDWKKVESQLHFSQVDPQKLNADLAQVKFP